MKVIRKAVCAVSLAVCGTGVAASDTLANQIVGAWQCSARTPQSLIAGRMVYKADGTMEADVSVAADIDRERRIELKVVSTASWKLLGTALVEERILTVNATSGTLDGKALPPETLATIGDRVPKEPSTSTVAVTASDLVLVDGDGTRTVCTR